MRGLAKPWPPSNVSPDGQEPRRFADAEQEFLAALTGRTDKAKFARTEFDQLDKAKLRRVMYGEQRSLCIYCERRVSELESPPRIEHWRPLSGDPELALHWDNLYLSCSTDDTCDRAKDKRRLKADDADPDLPWPTVLDYERLVGFTSRGEMCVRDDVPMGEATRTALELAIDDGQHDGRQRRAILNLNHPTLVAARSATLDSERTRLDRDFPQRTAAREERAARATQLLDQAPRPDFVSIRVAWLRKTLGRGR